MKLIIYPKKLYPHLIESLILSLRFGVKIKMSLNILFFYKTDKNKSFSKGHEPLDILFDMFKEIQTLPKINNKDNKNDIEIFNKFINFINNFIPHLLINSNSETNVIKS